MLTDMKVLANASDVMSRLNGWEISGIIAAVLVAGVAIWMLPELIRYMKIRHM